MVTTRGLPIECPGYRGFAIAFMKSVYFDVAMHAFLISSEYGCLLHVGAVLYCQYKLFCYASKVAGGSGRESKYVYRKAYHFSHCSHTNAPTLLIRTMSNGNPIQTLPYIHTYIHAHARTNAYAARLLRLAQSFAVLSL